MSKPLLRFALATVLFGASAHPAVAQPPDEVNPRATSTQATQFLSTDPAEPEPQGPAPVTRTGLHAYVYSVAHDFAAMPTMKSTYAILGGAGLLAAAAHNQDTHVNRHFQGGHTGFFAPGKYFGESYTIGAAAFVTYLAGRVKKNDKATHIGIDELRALLESELIVQGLKYTVRRERPEGSGYAFPSGHSADSFAAATVLQRHFGAKAAVPTYLLASYIAVSRLHENRHYVSDVIFGAGIGYVVGHTVTRHGKSNFVEFAMYPIAVPRGVGLAFVRTGRHGVTH